MNDDAMLIRLKERVVSNEFKTVPVVPTEAMMKAATVASVEGDIVYVAHTSEDWERFGKRSKRIMHIYNAMLAAAPDHAGEVVYFVKPLQYSLTDGVWVKTNQAAYDLFQLEPVRRMKFNTAPPRVVVDRAIREMERYLPVLERLESRPLAWIDLTDGLGIATLNGYKAALKAALEQTK